MKLSGWGRFPKIDSTRLPVHSFKDVHHHLERITSLIAYGNGRSYGDSALAENHMPMRRLNRFLEFDQENGTLTCETGVLLSDIIETFLPRGWFLKITPGTKLITVGGAISADVHGKNHHAEGSFSECVYQFKLLLPNGEICTCSRKKNEEYFYAVCGGMGLIGVILEATIQLKPVQSKWIDQTTIKTSNLDETFQAFEDFKDEPYSVAWIDTIAEGDKLGRSILNTGKFSEDKDLSYKPKKSLNVPFNFPSFLLNNKTIKIFNSFYYAKSKRGITHQKVDIDTFFYPLDSINNWNRVYGKKGFTQYQFILPKENSFDGLREILDEIKMTKFSSFLSVLKLYGRENKNYLSFPMEGYSMAMDFKIQPGLDDLMQNLNDLVVKFEGRIYLAKDATMDKETFEKGYKNLDNFRQIRQKLNADNKFNSLQSKRLGL